MTESTEVSQTGRRSLTAKILNRLSSIWLEFVTGFLWWGVGYVPSHHFRRFFYRLAGMKIGHGSTIHMMGRFFDPRFVTIGNDSIIGERVTIDGRRQLASSKSGVTIGNHVDIASEVMIWTSQHDLTDERFRAIEEPVVIEDYVFIGPRVIILPGVSIGRGAAIGAGAVVTKSVPANSIAAGVPAKVIGERAGELKYRLGRARWFQ